MDALAEIERAYDFRLPNAYRSLFERGYLTDSGESYRWVSEAEWLPPAKMLNRGGFWSNLKPGLVAFAFSAGRDLWAWQTKQPGDAEEPAIAYCPRGC